MTLANAQMRQAQFDSRKSAESARLIFSLRSTSDDIGDERGGANGIAEHSISSNLLTD